MTLLGKPVSIIKNSDGSSTVFYSNGLKQRLPKKDAETIKPEIDNQLKGTKNE